jgi:hypothetical protein
MKIVCLLLIFTIAIIGTASAMTLQISSAEGNLGDSIRVAIAVSDAQNLGSMDIVLLYNTSVLKIKAVGKGELNKGLISSNTNENDGIISIGIADSKGISGNGEIAVLTFEGIKEGTSEIAVLGVKAYDVNTHLEIPVDAQNGAVTVKQKSTPGFEIFSALVALALATSMLLRRR